MQNTAPIVNEQGQPLSRQFLGNLFPTTTIEKKELKTYLKGGSMFTYGRDNSGNPKTYHVRQRYFYK